MFKFVALAVFLGACHAADHAYSSQSIVRHDDHHKKNDVKVLQYVPIKYAIPAKYQAPVITKVAVPHKYVTPIFTKVAYPVVTKYVTKAVPVAHYVSESSGHEYGHEGHSSQHAVSSSHIHREDVPAKAPKDFYVEYGHPQYEFEYKVEDPHTGDSKFQHEARDGHVVKGVYSLHEADGSIRTVKYAADKHTGFIADVKHVTKHVETSKHHY